MSDDDLRTEDFEGMTGDQRVLDVSGESRSPSPLAAG